MTDAPLRFPKVHSPFKRLGNADGEYVAYDEVNDGYDWVFDNEDVLAVEKLDGTNCCVRIEETEEGRNITGYTRFGYQPMQYADPYGSRDHQYIVRAIQNSLKRGYLDGLGEGVHYGECVGESLGSGLDSSNPHELGERLFIPFQWLVDKCHYKSWGDYPKTFDSLSYWFEEELFSLFHSRMHGVDLDESSVSNGTFCEGIVFVHPDAILTDEIHVEEEHTSGGMYYKSTPHLAKLRRDMFDWYEGDRH